MGIARQLDRIARFRPRDEFLITDRDERFTYGDVDTAVTRVANALAGLGVSSGDKIGILASNTVRHLHVFYGGVRRGATIVPLNVRGGDEEISHQIDHDDVSVLYVGAEYVPTLDRIRDAVAVDSIVVAGDDAPDEALSYENWLRDASADPHDRPAVDADPASNAPTSVLYHTGGTTGVPKTVPWRAGMVEANTERLGLELGVTADDVLMIVTPLFHIGSALFGTYLAPYVGAKLVLLDGFSSRKTLEYVEREGVTHVLFVPSMIRAILSSDAADGGYDCSSVRKLSFTGENLDDATKARIADVFPEAAVWNVYGATEVGATMSSRPGLDRSRNCIGYPFADREVTIRDSDGRVVPDGERGEIWVRGEAIPDRYHGDVEMTAERYRNGATEDWFSTGDLGYVDEAGFVHYAGRNDDKIIRGGENIFPSEVEETLLDHEAVDEAVVFGVDHPVLGHAVAAAIVETDGADATAEGITEWCHDRLATYKIPDRIVFRERLPRTDAGKFDRATLRRTHGE